MHTIYRKCIDWLKGEREHRKHEAHCCGHLLLTDSLTEWISVHFGVWTLFTAYILTPSWSEVYTHHDRVHHHHHHHRLWLLTRVALLLLFDLPTNIQSLQHSSLNLCTFESSFYGQPKSEWLTGECDDEWLLGESRVHTYIYIYKVALILTDLLSDRLFIFKLYTGWNGKKMV